MLAANRIVAILAPDSAPVLRMIRNARRNGTAIDMTYGRKTKAAVVLDTGHAALAAIQPETIVNRLKPQREESHG